MIEPRLARVRAFIERLLHKGNNARLHPPATETQVAAYEKTLGLPLPEELRGFLLSVADGMELGDDTGLTMFPLIGGHELPLASCARLVKFPIQQVKDKAASSTNSSWVIHRARGWSEMSGHEQMESDVALHFATAATEEAFLVLSGSKRGLVWFASVLGGVKGSQGVPFLDALHTLLGARRRERIQSVGRGSGRLQMRPPARWEQLEEYEKTLGLALPDEFREFVCQVADGFDMGYLVSMSVFTLFGDIPSYSSDIHPRLVVFPIQQLLASQGTNPPTYPIAGTKYARGWAELTGHEQMESEVALHFGMLEGEEVILVLSGAQRGTVWFTNRFGGLSRSDPQGLTFLKALDYLLGKVE